jgi:hypothetical protein
MTVTTARFKELTAHAARIGHPSYPWLSAVYSPSSRTPSCDLTPIVRDLLNAGDTATIKLIMRAVLEANPGLSISIGSDDSPASIWIDPLVDSIATMDLSRFVQFNYDNAATNLRSLFIVLSKDGGGREFWLLNRTPDIIATALCPDEPEWRTSLEELRRKANAFIEKMRKDTPYWLDYPLFDPLVVLKSKLPSTEALDRFRMLPLMSRVQLVYLIKRGGGPATNSTDYAIRSLGLEVDKSLALAVDLGLLRLSNEPQIVLNALPKDTLLEAANDAGVEVRKSWAKSKIISTMEVTAPNLVRKLQTANPTFEVEPGLASDLNEVIRYSEQNASNMSMLAFA